VSPIRLLSRRSRLANLATSSGLDVTPVPFRPGQAPWFQAQVPGLWTCVLSVAGLPPAFRDLRRFLPAAFTSRLPILDQAYDTAFASLVPVSSGRVLGQHATPDSSRLNQSPLVISPGPSRYSLSGDDFPRERLPISVALLSPRGSQGPVGHAAIFVLQPPAACSGLHATPAVVAQQSFLTPNRGQDPDELR
jgi:hypothetical protein